MKLSAGKQRFDLIPPVSPRECFPISLSTLNLFPSEHSCAPAPPPSPSSLHVDEHAKHTTRGLGKTRSNKSRRILRDVMAQLQQNYIWRVVYRPFQHTCCASSIFVGHFEWSCFGVEGGCMYANTAASSGQQMRSLN